MLRVFNSGASNPSKQSGGSKPWLYIRLARRASAKPLRRPIQSGRLGVDTGSSVMCKSPRYSKFENHWRGAHLVLKCSSAPNGHQNPPRSFRKLPSSPTSQTLIFFDFFMRKLWYFLKAPRWFFDVRQGWRQRGHTMKGMHLAPFKPPE